MSRITTQAFLKEKFMQSLAPDMLERMKAHARTRGITVQELIRAVIIPQWESFLGDEQGMRKAAYRHYMKTYMEKYRARRRLAKQEAETNHTANTA